MSPPRATAAAVLPAQVWPALPAERQVRAIQLLAELALALVTRPAAPCPQEAPDVDRAAVPQDPPRALRATGAHLGAAVHLDPGA